MTDHDKIKDIDEAYNEAYLAENSLLLEIEEDDKFYLGDQWDYNDIAALKEDDPFRPYLTINQIFKPINLVTGYYRQNKLDLKYFPVEGSVQETADIYTECAKWILENGGGRENISITFGDAARGGLGWLEIEMDYSQDPINGDIRITSGNKYHYFFDPNMTDPELTNCNYIVRYAWMNKGNAINLFPDMEKDIRKVKSGIPSKFNVQMRTGTYDLGDRVNIIEKWYRTYEKMMIVIDPHTFESYEWKGGKRKFNQLLEAMPGLQGKIQLVEIRVPKIKLISSINNNILLHDGTPPVGFDDTMYPFMPMFCYYVPNFNDWTYKVQGIVRPLKDPQRERNKIRSIMMDAAMTIPTSGWIYKTNVPADPAQLEKTGAGVKIELKSGGLGDGLWPTPDKNISPVLVQLHEQLAQDMVNIGPNADMLSMIGNDSNASSADASGASLEFRVKQGLMTLQNPFDGSALTHRMLGRYLIKLINRWSPEKIARIIKRDVPKQFSDNKYSARFDCIVDTKTNSPTYQMAIYSQLRDYVRHGIEIPQAVLREVADIPAKIKKLWAEQEKMQIESQMQEKQAERQLENARIAAMINAPVKEKTIEMEGKKEIEKMRVESDKEIQSMNDINDLTIAQIKNKGSAKSRLYK